MADITLSYKGSTIAEISDSATKTMNTAGKYCEDDITLVYVQPQAGAQFTITVSVDSGSAVTATDGTTTVTGTSVNDECVLTVPNAGTWTVSATLSGNSASKVIVIVEDYPITLTYADPVLANNTPAQIQKVAQAGMGANFWSVGDRTSEIAFLNTTVGALNMNGLKTCAYIIGFNHNDAIEGTGIHFQVGITTNNVAIGYIDSYYGTRPRVNSFRMSSVDSYRGWGICAMREVVCPAFLNAIPTNWRSVIKTCVKYTDNATYSDTTVSPSDVTGTNDKIFLLSEFEVFGTTTAGNSAEQSYQKQYAYYANGNSKIKYQYNSTSTAIAWWTRTPDVSTRRTATSNYCSVTTSGGMLTGRNTLSAGFTPAFMIG